MPSGSAADGDRDEPTNELVLYNFFEQAHQRGHRPPEALEEHITETEDELLTSSRRGMHGRDHRHPPAAAAPEKILRAAQSDFEGLVETKTI
jgi:hypothetical protein